jgi:hypothetical protein
MRCEVLTAVPTMFWDVAPCNLVDGYQDFGEPTAPNSEYFSTLKMEVSSFSETLVSSTKLYGATIQETSIWTVFDLSYI